jgi:peptidoglycan glycosyltransferase
VNAKLRRLALGLIVAYVLLFVQLNRLQVFGAEGLNDNPNNNREVVRDFSRPRGQVLSAEGLVLAKSEPVDDRYQYLRTYPLGDLFAHSVGFFSFQYGTDGIERQYNDVLAGQTDEQRLDRVLGGLFDDRVETGDVITTLDVDIQQAAKEALGEREGSVVALDPRTGAVLALWSYPSYDPNLLSSHDFDLVSDVRQLLVADGRKPLLAHTYQERYMPGSTFKVVTTQVALETGVATPGTVFEPSTEWTPPQTTDPITNYGGTRCGGDLLEVFRRSCNIPFAQMGVLAGAEAMVAGAEGFGFNQDVPIDLPRPVRSFFPPVEAFDQDIPKLAQVSFGQNDVAATPLQMALEAAAVANRGVIMQPYVVQETRSRDGSVLSRTTPRPWRTAMRPETAAWLNGAMVEVVNNGTARCCMQLEDGAQAAAKTGTAQLGTDPPLSHAWITSFAPAEAPRVVVTVMVKASPEVSAGTGGTVAGPVAKQVLDVALRNADPLAG